MIKTHHQDTVQSRQNNIKILPEKIELLWSFISTNLKMSIKSERVVRSFFFRDLRLQTITIVWVIRNGRRSLLFFNLDKLTSSNFKMEGHFFFGINCLLYKCTAIKKYSIEKSWLNFYNYLVVVAYLKCVPFSFYKKMYFIVGFIPFAAIHMSQ